MFFPDLESRIPEENAPVHVVNIDIQDNHEEATIGAFMICELALLVSSYIIFFYIFISLANSNMNEKQPLYH